MRALFAWELGDNFGHIAQILNIAKILSEHGWEIFFALKNPLALKDFYIDFDYTILQAPYQMPHPVYDAPLTYAEDLMGCGYNDPQNLAMLTRCWLDMFDLVKPDAVIVETAPTALLAAQTRGIKSYSFGSGYNIPPATTPMSPLCYWTNPATELLEKSEATALRKVNEALALLDIPALNCFADILNCDKEFLCTISELDHYPEEFRQNNQYEYYGAFFKTDSGKRYEWKKGEYKRIFAYIHPNSHAFNECVHALRSLSADYDIILVAPRLAPEFIHQIETDTLRVSDEIVQLGNLFDQCDLAVTHASQGISSAFVLNGVPLVMVPKHVEQLMFGYKIASWGGGELANEPYAARGIAQHIQKVLQDTDIKNNVETLAKRYKNYDVKKQAQRIAEEINAGQSK